MSFLSNFIMDNDVRSVLDYGCGDWQFSRYVCWENVRYHGVDVVRSVVDENKRLFESENVTFSVMEDLEALPEVDLAVSKDVFQHLPITTVKEIVAVLKRKAKFLLITNDIFPDQWLNVEIPPGAGRAIKLQQEPFNEKAVAVFSYPVICFGNAWQKQCVFIAGDRF